MTESRLRIWLAKLWWGDPAEATLGRRGERAAARHLKSHGYRLIARNVHLSAGECDLLMRAPDKSTLVVVEVKTRRITPGKPHPPPEASVHAHKQAKLTLLANLLRRDRRYKNQPIRIDIAAVDWPDNGKPIVRHFPNAVRA